MIIRAAIPLASCMNAIMSPVQSDRARPGSVRLHRPNAAQFHLAHATRASRRAAPVSAWELMRNRLDAARAWAFSLAAAHQDRDPKHVTIPRIPDGDLPAIRGGHVDTDQTAHNQHRPRGRTSPVDRGARRVVGAFPFDRSHATTSGGSLPRKLRRQGSFQSRSVTIHRPGWEEGANEHHVKPTV